MNKTLAVAVATFLLAAGFTAAAAVPLDSPRRAARYVVPGAQVAFYGNVAGSWKVLEKLLASFKKVAGRNDSVEVLKEVSALDQLIRRKAEELTKDVGVDPLKDISSVFVSFGMAADSTFTLLMVVRGNFDHPALFEQVYGNSQNGIREYKGRKLLEAPIPQLRDGGALHLGKSRVVFGSNSAVEAYLDGITLSKEPFAAKVRRSAPEKAVFGLVVDAAALLGISAVRTHIQREMGTLLGYLNSLTSLSVWATEKSATAVLKLRDARFALEAHRALTGFNELLAGLRPTIRGLGYILAAADGLVQNELPPTIVDLLKDKETFVALVDWLADVVKLSGTVKLNKKANSVTWQLKGNVVAAGMAAVGAGAAAWFLFQRNQLDKHVQEVYPDDMIEHDDNAKTPIQWIYDGAYGDTAP